VLRGSKGNDLLENSAARLRSDRTVRSGFPCPVLPARQVWLCVPVLHLADAGCNSREGGGRGVTRIRVCVCVVETAIQKWVALAEQAARVCFASSDDVPARYI
jgi:hypothetical protein